jgi:L-alanine-DL-glutamate epimerase-like enolase superfamily enzyme
MYTAPMRIQADFAETCRDRGYPAFKIHPHSDPDTDIATCRAVAEAVGDEMDLMIDPASEYETYAETLRVGRAIDDLGFFWYEDPMADVGESTYMNSRLRDEIDTSVLGGEHVRGGPHRRPTTSERTRWTWSAQTPTWTAASPVS